jgi:tetratricopeptide (TPR) repeat protein
VRSAALAEAWTAAGDDASMLQANPAGLARVGGTQLILMHDEWSAEAGLRREHLGLAQGLGRASGLGVSVDYLSLGELTARDVDGSLGGSSGAYGINGSVGFASSLLAEDALKLGASFEWAQEQLLGQTSSGLGGGLGALYDFGSGLSVGGSLQHLGSGPGGASLPMQGAVGFGWAFPQRRGLIGLDAVWLAQAPSQLRAGLELQLGALALRGGWRQALGAPDGDVLGGPSLGAGFRSGVFALDYAFVPYGGLGAAHRVAASLDLPADFFKPRVVGMELSTATARAFYDKAESLRRAGDLLPALIQYQRAKDAYPPDQLQQGPPADYYSDGLARIAELEKQLNSGGDSEGLRKAIARYVNEGQQAQHNGRLREAIAQYRAALGLAPQAAEAATLLSQAEGELKARRSQLSAEAESAWDAGRLNTAIQKYREVEVLEPDNEEAREFFSAHHREILDDLQLIHRRGIDLYVGGKMREAVALWKDGLRLDPSDPIGFERDIEKAEKVLRAQER